MGGAWNEGEDEGIRKPLPSSKTLWDYFGPTLVISPFSNLQNPFCHVMQHTHKFQGLKGRHLWGGHYSTYQGYISL